MSIDEESAVLTEGKPSKKMQTKRYMEEDKEQERRRDKSRSSDGKTSKSERERSREGGYHRRCNDRRGDERDRKRRDLGRESESEIVIDGIERRKGGGLVLD